MKARTTDDWLEQLQPGHAGQAEALTDLREHLLRAALYCLNQRRASLHFLSGDDIKQMAEDCAQDALLAILAHLREFRRDSEFTTWAYKFAVNVSLMAVRREQYKGASLDDLLANANLDALFADARPSVDPDTSAVRKEVWTTVRDVIEHDLTERQQLALRAIAFGDIPMDVVAAHLGTNRNAVYKLLHDARSRLKHVLEQRGFGMQEIIGSFSAPQG